MPELRTDTERPDVRPEKERESRPETERRDFDDWDDVRELRPPAREPWEPRELPLCEPCASRPPAVTPVGGEATRPVGDTTGARPQVSQYSSPPPTSSYAPPHSGR
ncbi:hypothetical protein BU52_18195 [Streptomyces toyocaensis]|uniref:Uncharacterized protein n=1 Tax=Streptomyces toyocaensis TaxID=55952 RepID=A0A081XQB6_STRTO|nr:hypothetical protein BU52_18195 [Streptomyces toyocaensis]